MKARLLRVVNPILAIAFTLQLLTGFFPQWFNGLGFRIHLAGAYILIAAVAAHLLLNADWFVYTYLKTGGKRVVKQGAGSKDSAADARVKVTANGPYKISGSLPMEQWSLDLDAEGLSTGYVLDKTFPVKESMHLCRCGHAKNKPFCDGSHKVAGFNGKETAGIEGYLRHPQRTEGPEVDMTDIDEVCASARFCDRAGGAWDAVRASADPAKKALAIEEVHNCPAGRLELWDKQGKPIEPVFEKSIVLIKDTATGGIGPIWLRGGVPVESADGRTYAIRNRVTLCRCGKSANKPFCDGVHTET